jgi:hypothetical protein
VIRKRERIEDGMVAAVEGVRLEGAVEMRGGASELLAGDLGQAGEGPGGGQAGRRSAPPVPRAHFFWLFFLHAELQDPQIEKHGNPETKTDQDKKHVCFLQTEVQFVVFSFLGPEDLALPTTRPLGAALRRGVYLLIAPFVQAPIINGWVFSSPDKRECLLIPSQLASAHPLP